MIDLAPDDPSLLCDGVAFDPDAGDVAAPVAPYEIVLGRAAPVVA